MHLVSSQRDERPQQGKIQMTRNERLLADIDIGRQSGLEIGALGNPVVPASCAGIRYVDHLSTDGLQKNMKRTLTLT